MSASLGLGVGLTDLPLIGAGQGTGPIPWEIDTTAEAIRAAIRDIAAWGYSPHNLLLQSQTFNDGYWSKVSTTVSADVAAAPNGTTTADLIYPASSGDDRIAWRASATTVVAGTQYTLSVYARASGKRWLYFGTLAGATVPASLACFDLLNGVIGQRGSYFSSHAIESAGGGWYRCSATVTVASTSGYPLFGIADADASGSVTASGTDGILIWGAQLNLGPTALPYVPTTSAAVGPTAPGWRIPGAAGARVSGDARTSLAMEQAADGSWGFARHNMIRNSVMAGAVVGTPGTIPTQWAVVGTGLTFSVVALGVEDSLPYIDIRVSGTTGGTFAGIRFESNTQIAAAANQTWTASVFARMVGGSTANLNALVLDTVYLTAAQANVNSGSTSFLASPTATSLLQARRTSTTVAGVGSVAHTRSQILMTFSAGVAIDITLRIAQPELYQGAVRTGIIPTTTAARYAPAIDWVPEVSAYGLRAEDARTNSIRNNTMQGAVAGSPGTFPTNWQSGSANGLVASVVGTGTDASTGLPYIEINYAGTATGNNIFPSFEPNLQVAAVSGQTWSLSVWCAFVGAGRPDTTTVRINARYVSGSLGFIDAVVAPTTAMTRVSVSGTLSDALTTHITPGIRWGLTIGVAYDFTVRYACPQLEQGDFVTSPILTYGTTATRAADTPTIPLGPWFNTSEGTLAASYYQAVTPASSFRYVLSLSNGTATNEFIGLGSSTTTPTRAFRVLDGGAAQASMALGSPAIGSHRLVGTWAANNFAATGNGEAIATDVSGTVPQGLNTLNIGRTTGVSGLDLKYITRTQYSRLRLPNSRLPAVVT